MPAGPARQALLVVLQLPRLGCARAFPRNAARPLQQHACCHAVTSLVLTLLSFLPYLLACRVLGCLGGGGQGHHFCASAAAVHAGSLCHRAGPRRVAAGGHAARGQRVQWVGLRWCWSPPLQRGAETCTPKPTRQSRNARSTWAPYSVPLALLTSLLQAEFDGVRKEMEKEAKRAAKLEQKVGLLVILKRAAQRLQLRAGVRCTNRQPSRGRVDSCTFV